MAVAVVAFIQDSRLGSRRRNESSSSKYYYRRYGNGQRLKNETKKRTASQERFTHVRQLWLTKNNYVQKSPYYFYASVPPPRSAVVVDLASYLLKAQTDG